jgi:hypothetical protein
MKGIKFVISVILLINQTLAFNDNRLTESSTFTKKWEIAQVNFQKFIQMSKNQYVVTLSDILLNSIDEKCAEEKLQNLDWTETFNNLTSRIDNLNEKEQIGLHLMYAGIGSICTSKNRPILEFFFDAIMSFGHLVRAFMNEPELSEYFFYLRCANNYAINENIWDNKKYPINFKLQDEELVECSLLKTIVDSHIEEMKDLSSEEEGDEECLEKSLRGTLAFALRTLLLTQVDLTSEDKQIEKEIFIKENNRLNEESMICMYEPMKNAIYMALYADESEENTSEKYKYLVDNEV